MREGVQFIADVWTGCINCVEIYLNCVGSVVLFTITCNDSQQTIKRGLDTGKLLTSVLPC